MAKAKKFKLYSVMWEDLEESLEEFETKGWGIISVTAIGDGDFAVILKKNSLKKK